ncbi:uncharacterized protein LOC125177672 [Hyalella azteca]|uniref:Uncharacterized protein LOC125177672 n=1 Tax=Hyalella azteca TaxID=294128 RepID=A0A979FGG9_HYAAZ|nr:uncharacterized protein LOC125177672 [Hyalella azteca]
MFMMKSFTYIFAKFLVVYLLFFHANAAIKGRFKKLLDGSKGELNGSFSAYNFLSIHSCGAQCVVTTGCWAWSYDRSSARCHVFPAAVPLVTTGIPSSFMTFGSTKNLINGYFVPTNRVQSWTDGNNTCTNLRAKMAYVPDSNKMREIMAALSDLVIFIGLQRTSPGASTWKDSFGNSVPATSITWQPSQPDNANGKENCCLSFNGTTADIDPNEINPHFVLCTIPI